MRYQPQGMRKELLAARTETTQGYCEFAATLPEQCDWKDFRCSVKKQIPYHITWAMMNYQHIIIILSGAPV